MQKELALSKKKIVIHGGSSDLTKNIIGLLYHDYDKFFVFCNNLILCKKNLNKYKKKITFIKNNLQNFKQTLSCLKKLPKNLNGVIWISGSTGNAKNEFKDFSLCQSTIKINFLNVILSINYLLKNKLNLNKSSFLCVVTSVAGLRGRKINIFYGACKAGLISYLSSLRQKYNQQIRILTIIPGYIKTKRFKKKTLKFLVSTAFKAASIIVKALKTNKEVVYIDFKWKLIMFIIKLIPEKIFKKLNF